jgi:hypothetical protein
MRFSDRPASRFIVIVVALITAIVSGGVPASAARRATDVGTSTTYDLPEQTFQANATKLIRDVACEYESQFANESGQEGADHNENLYVFLIAKAALLANQRAELAGADPVQGCRENDMVPEGVGCLPASLPTALCLSDQVNEVLGGMQVTAQLGTNGIPCGTPLGSTDGDYDFGLRGLIWLISKFPVSLDPTKPGMRPGVYTHVRDDLLIVSGTPNQPPRVGEYGYDIDGCGNEEKTTGSPSQRAAGHEAVKSICEDLLGPGASACAPSYPAPTGDTGEDDFCGSGWAATLICAVAIALILALIAIGAGVAAAGILGILAASGPVGAAIAIAAAVAAGGAAGLGAVLPVAGAITGGRIPETENHILEIETSRVLINELFAHDYGVMRTDPDCVTDEAKKVGCVAGAYTGATDLFDITKNKSAEWMLELLGQTLQHDFVEFNSRPYQRMSVISLLNLYDLVCRFSCDGDRLKLKIAARAILDHLSAKFAVSNSSLRRWVPYRRHDDERDGFYALARSASENGLYQKDADFQTQRFLMYADPALVPACGPVADSAVPAIPVPAQFCGQVVNSAKMAMLAAAVSDYRLPPELMAMIEVAKETTPDGSVVIRSGCGGQLQRYRHDGDEIYDCARSYTLTAGGRKTKAAYFTAGFSKGDDEGTPLSTTLMPTGVQATLDDLFRFEGSEDNNEDDETNLCVDRGFACGYLPVVPARYQGLGPDCRQVSGNWTFIDTTCARTPGTVRADLWVAVWCSDQEECAEGDDDAFGVLEVVEATRMRETGATFSEFVFTVLARNQGSVPFEEEGDTYRRFDGSTVEFDVEEGVIQGQSSSGMASGDLVIAPGDGCEAIIDRAGNQLLILSLVNPQQPFIRRVDSADTSGLAGLCAGPWPLAESER